MMIDQIRPLIQNACQDPHNPFGTAFLEQHIAVVQRYALRLAVLIAADAEIVELAAYLHDLAAIQCLGPLAEHAERGAQLAVEVLCKFDYPQERIAKVAECIRSHSNPLPYNSTTPEAFCISQADAMAQIARPAYWMYVAFSLRTMEFQEGCAWYARRIESHWQGLAEASRAMLAAEYPIARRLCGLLET